MPEPFSGSLSFLHVRRLVGNELMGTDSTHDRIDLTGAQLAYSLLQRRSDICLDPELPIFNWVDQG